MHMCTHLPEDPEVVLAVVITQDTYETIYLKLPAGTHLDFDTVSGSYIIVPLNDVDWGWMSRKDFHDAYEPNDDRVVDPGSDEQFTMWKARSK